MGTLISVDDQRLKSCRFFDCRTSLADPQYGEREFALGHIPRALFADLNVALSAPIIPGQTGRHPLPERTDFLRQVRAWGITEGDLVVVYDEDSGAFAARLWWMLRWLGHANVCVLDGGLRAWTDAGLALETTDGSDSPSAARAGSGSTFEISSPLTRQLPADEVLNWSGLLLDARDPARFLGQTEPVDPVAGHIPGAINAPFADNLDDGRFRSPEELRERYEALGANQSSAIACYCGSGVTAAHNILALIHAGFDEPYLYPGSWSEWITDPDRPVA